jgi:hypothetical protein
MIELYEAIKKFYPESVLHIHNTEFPELEKGDFIITFSDNPLINAVCDEAKLNNAKVIVYQLSYGMALERERKVVSHPDVIVCCSTQHIQTKILDDIGCNKKIIHYIGHSQEQTIKEFYPEESLVSRGTRYFDVAIMTHNSPDKRFQEAFDFCKSQGLEIVLFGARNNNFNLNGAKRVFFNADRDTMRWIFNNSKKYLSFSKTEGLNRPGVESMLCGCIPYIYDGCEIFSEGYNCIKIQDPEEILDILEIPEYNIIKKDLEKYTMKNTLDNLGKVINVKF